MKEAKVLIGCIVLSIATLLPHIGNAASASKVSPQRKKAAKSIRSVSQINLRSIDPLKEAFQRDAGKVRLVMILSPT